MVMRQQPVLYTPAVRSSRAHPPGVRQLSASIYSLRQKAGRNVGLFVSQMIWVDFKIAQVALRQS
jgi:hypothetical protein